MSEFEFRHGSLLAYLGDSRPRGPNVQPEASVELREFLDVKGMTVKEFASMRGGQDEVQDAVDELDSKESTPVPDATAGQASISFPPPQFPPPGPCQPIRGPDSGYNVATGVRGGASGHNVTRAEAIRPPEPASFKKYVKSQKHVAFVYIQELRCIVWCHSEGVS